MISSSISHAARHARTLGVFCTLGLVMLAAHSATADPMGAISLVGHRAIYELKLKKASDKSGISQATGLLVFEMDGDNCVGYTANMHIRTSLTSTAGKVNIIDTRQAAWEGPDSTVMRFGSKEYLNSNLAAEVEGKAEKGDGDSGGTASFVKPEGKVELPVSAVFPMEHTKRLVTAGRKGEVINRTVVFNGTDFNKLYTAVAFIGKAKGQDGVELPESLSDRTAFDGQRAWPISVSYYEYASDETSGEQVPAYEISFTMFENGVSTNLLMGYEHFSIQGTLSELTIFEPSECEQ